MKLLDQLFLNAARDHLTRSSRRSRRLYANRWPRMTKRQRSTRRCSSCFRLEPSYRLIHPEGRRVQLCPACRASELENARVDANTRHDPVRRRP